MILSARFSERDMKIEKKSQSNDDDYYYYKCSVFFMLDALL